MVVVSYLGDLAVGLPQKCRPCDCIVVVMSDDIRSMSSSVNSKGDLVELASKMGVRGLGVCRFAEDRLTDLADSDATRTIATLLRAGTFRKVVTLWPEDSDQRDGAVFLRVAEAIRSLPKNLRPKQSIDPR